MTFAVVGKADRNITVDSLMGERARTGADYLDLKTGELVKFSDITTPAPVPAEITEPPQKKKYTKEELDGMAMKDLREIGRPLGAADTKKSELIEEILQKQ